MSCGAGHRRGSDLALLWPWHRPAAAAPIQPLARELPCAVDVALKGPKGKKKEMFIKRDNPMNLNSEEPKP